MKGSLVQCYLDNLDIPTDKIACTDGEKEISYGELNKRSGQIASLLFDCGVRRQDRVALCLNRSAEFLPAILGVLRADAVYVPLDPKSPPARWQQIVADCAPAALICDSRTLSSLGAAIEISCPTILLGRRCHLPEEAPAVLADIEDLATFPPFAGGGKNGSDDLAYVLYTSGSTGLPKGVMISHRNICNYIDWAVDYFAIGAEDRVLGTAPFHFDMSTFDLWSPVKAGATLCVANNMHTLFPEKLLEFMENQQITIWKGISSLLFYLDRAGVLAPERLRSLSRVLFGGDELPARTLMRWMKTFPDKAFYNVYGPTEATGISLCYAVAKAPENNGERIPIGRPCKSMKALLLDDQLMPVEDGQIGELCLSGPGLGAGYLNDPVRTAQSFFTQANMGEETDTWYRTGDLALRRTDGNYEFIGRKDNQVKIMGYRIELGEIEQALRAVEGVLDAAVVKVSRDGLDELVAFVEGPEEQQNPQILKQLRGRIPAYMLPRRVVTIADLPRCRRGKIDRATLREQALEVGHGD